MVRNDTGIVNEYDGGPHIRMGVDTAGRTSYRR